MQPEPRFFRGCLVASAIMAVFYGVCIAAYLIVAR